MNKKILILFPTIQEASIIKNKYAPNIKTLGLEDSFDFKTQNADFKAFIMGYGCLNSEKRISIAIDSYKPDAVLLLGYAGACRSNMNLGDLFYSGKGEALIDCAKSLGGVAAKMKTEKKFAGHLRKIELGEKYNYDVVEMEYDYVERVCLKKGIDFICLRVISDTMTTHSPIEFFNAMMDEVNGGNKVCRALFSLIKKPSNIFLIKRFVKEITQAFVSYSKVIPQYIENIKL